MKTFRTSSKKLKGALILAPFFITAKPLAADSEKYFALMPFRPRAAPKSGRAPDQTARRIPSRDRM
jgi:hypothetical protein